MEQELALGLPPSEPFRACRRRSTDPGGRGAAAGQQPRGMLGVWETLGEDYQSRLSTQPR